MRATIGGVPRRGLNVRRREHLCGRWRTSRLIVCRFTSRECVAAWPPRLRISGGMGGALPLPPKSVEGGAPPHPPPRRNRGEGGGQAAAASPTRRPCRRAPSTIRGIFGCLGTVAHATLHWLYQLRVYEP